MIFRVENKQAKNQDIPALFIPKEGDWCWEYLNAACLPLRLHLAWSVWTTVGLLVSFFLVKELPWGLPQEEERDVQTHSGFRCLQSYVSELEMRLQSQKSQESLMD